MKSQQTGPSETGMGMASHNESVYIGNKVLSFAICADWANTSIEQNRRYTIPVIISILKGRPESYMNI
jgi:hypothetical protein